MKYFAATLTLILVGLPAAIRAQTNNSTYSTEPLACASGAFDSMEKAANARALYDKHASAAARNAAVAALAPALHALREAESGCGEYPSHVTFRNGFLVTYNAIYAHFTHASDAGDGDLILANQMLHQCMTQLEGTPEGASCERRYIRNEKIAPVVGDN